MARTREQSFAVVRDRQSGQVLATRRDRDVPPRQLLVMILEGDLSCTRDMWSIVGGFRGVSFSGFPDTHGPSVSLLDGSVCFGRVSRFPNDG